jgi:hypothetical protein
MPAAEQQRLRQGTIAVGDGFDAVYIALGKPDVRRERTQAHRRETVWIYKTYYRTYAGSTYAGYRRIVYFDPSSRRYFVSHEPVYADIYREHAEDQIRITFVEGRATVIEQQKR